MPRRMVRQHGTDTGYYQHQRLGDMPACPDCVEAHRLVQIDYRARNGVSGLIRDHQAARNRALAALRRRYPADFRRLYEQELDRVEK